MSPWTCVGNNELGSVIGDSARCPNCGKFHAVKYGEEILRDGSKVPSKLLAVVNCSNGKTYLVGIDGQEIKNGDSAC